MENNKYLEKTANLFKELSDYTRIRILDCLIHKELSVSEICKELNMSQSAISHQLRILKDNNLVNYKRVKASVYYSLADEHVATLISTGLEHIKE